MENDPQQDHGDSNSNKKADLSQGFKGLDQALRKHLRDAVLSDRSAEAEGTHDC